MESLFCCCRKCKFIYSAECDLENQFNNQLIFKIMLTLNEIENLEKKITKQIVFNAQMNNLFDFSFNTSFPSLDL